VATSATSPTRFVRNLFSERHRELLLLGGVLTCGFAVVSLAGWHPGDPTPLNPGTGRVENYCGMLGATIADALFLGLGHGAWVVALPVGFGFVMLAGRKPMTLTTLVSGSSLYIVGLGTLDLALRPGGAFPPGGLVGRVLVTALESSAGVVGAVLALSAGAIFSLTFLFDVDWRRIASRIVDGVELWVPLAIRWLGLRLASAGRLGLGVSAGVGGHVVRAGRGATASSGGLLTRMVDALRRGASSAQEWERLESVDEPESVLDDLDSAAEDPTHVAGPAVLAEVEWDPTSYSPRSTTSGREAAAEAPRVVAPLPVRTSTAARFAEPVRVPAPEPKPRVAVAQIDTDLSAFDAMQRVSLLGDASYEADEDELDEEEIASELDEDEDAFESVARSTGTDGFGMAPLRMPAARSSAAPAPVSVAKNVRQVTLTPEPEDQVVPAHVSGGRYIDLRHRDDGRAVDEADGFKLPPLSLLDEVPEQRAVIDEIELQSQALIIEEKLGCFKIGGKVVGIRPGPVVTIFEFQPDPGVKVSKITGLTDDLKMALRAVTVRIVAPIPGTDVVGIEIPSKDRLTIYLREMLASKGFKAAKHTLPCILGKDVGGEPVVADLAKMPHLLIGGTTGSGKSVGVNGMLMSLLYTRSPEDLRLLLVDPKFLEFQPYADIPHLLHPVITDPKKAAGALSWACVEMDRRYQLLARWGTRNIKGYNAKVEEESKSWTAAKAHRYTPEDFEPGQPLPLPERLPYIVIVIDELADLMLQVKKDVEEHISRLAAKARACGIHLIIATQRPSVDVITGVIKTNLPTRIAYRLQSGIDSRTVLGAMGAETLLGHGDMLYIPPGASDLVRCHGAFVDDAEVERVCDFLRDQAKPQFVDVSDPNAEALDVGEERHPRYREALEVVISKGKASTSLVQRALGIGYNKAADIVECMEADGFVGPADGARPREVLIQEVPSWLA